MNKQYDYIVVGQGLAGTILARMMLQQGKNILVIDRQDLSSASRIAAGIVNPVVFKRLAKSWMADELLATMDDFYKKEELDLSQSFYFRKNIVKLFTDPAEKDLWAKKQKEEIGRYLLSPEPNPFLPGKLHETLGAAEVSGSGNLDTAAYLQRTREHFRENNHLLEEEFEFPSLQSDDSQVSYKDLVAKKIIFCDGYKGASNPFFSYLPFKLTKGEILTVGIPDLDISGKVVNKGVFILPQGNQLYKVGATYEWNDLTESPTDKGRAELCGKLGKVICVPYAIAEHTAGVRPTVSDRRPLLGLHPDHPSVGIFNGLGTKGVMLAPYFAAQFLSFLENNTDLHPEVTISRFAHRRTPQ